MKRLHVTRRALSIVAIALFGAAGTAYAQKTDISNNPLTQSVTTAVKPNIMFTLDSSGSMGWDYNGDYVNDSNVVRSYCSNNSCSNTSTVPRRGDAPYEAWKFNLIAYNPTFTYDPPVNYDGTLMKSQTDFTKVQDDPFVDPSSTVNLTTSFPEVVFCKNNGDSATDTTNCRRNGIDNASQPFLYSSQAFPNGTSSGNFRYPKTRNGAPFYYEIQPIEYCSDLDLVNCQLATAPSGTFIHPAPVRFCRTSTFQSQATAVTGSDASGTRCQQKWDSNHKFPRFGKYKRVDIVAASAPFTGRDGRTDCAAKTSCTYTEEMTNYANWYAYYRTRMNMMKTLAGQSFVTIDDKYRVGFITINPATNDSVTSSSNPVSSTRFLPIKDFDAAQKKAFYEMFYAQKPNSNTPLREALARVGRYFANKKDGINSGMNDDPIQYSCQTNFNILTTDGYWNGRGDGSGYGIDIDGKSMASTDVDNVDSGTGTEAPFSSRAVGVYDGNIGAAGTLADIALYYYATDLRDSKLGNAKGALGTDVSSNAQGQQRMTTFTIGIADGLMRYQPDYVKDTNSDFNRIRLGATNCLFSGTGTCNWPKPTADAPSALDDLWHAAVNGRGQYYSAVSADLLSTGLRSALAGIKSVTAASAASATSTPNITESNNFIFSSTYRTVSWYGEVVAQKVDPATGSVIPTVLWTTHTYLDAIAPEKRKIFTVDSGGNAMDFTTTALDTTTKAWLKSKCALLSQCVSLGSSDQALLNDPDNMIQYVRGSSANTPDVFRLREHTLGDTINPVPQYVQAPTFSFTDAVTPSYGSFKTAQASRNGVLYIGANDGMMHAFEVSTGKELWAYIPRQLVPELYRLADVNYAGKHQFYVDGTPRVMDIFDGSKWRTILVGGLNFGGRGYYALDITDPASPAPLWEICNDSTRCSVVDPDMGYTFGVPVIAKRPSDGKWVAIVTSGYNNDDSGTATAGQGVLYVLDALTGKILERAYTGVGAATGCKSPYTDPCPSGLGKIAGWTDNFNLDNTVTQVYGGDLFGNLWKFDLTVSPIKVTKIASFVDPAGKPQSITATPELGMIKDKRVIYVGTGRYIGIKDLQDPATISPALPFSYLQSVYAVKDNGSTFSTIRSDSTFVQNQIVDLTATTRTVKLPTGTSSIDWTSKNGWYFDLATGSSATYQGERVMLDPILVLGTLVVTTTIPGSDACTAGGTSWTYQVDYSSGQFVSNSLNQVAGTLSASAVIVGNVVVKLPSGSMKIIQTDATGNKVPLPLNVAPGATTGRRVSYRVLNDN